MKVTTKQWADALEAACEGKTPAQVTAIAGELVRTLASRGELGKAREIVRRLTVTVSAETARPLKAATRKAIEDAAGAPVTEVVRPELIGGLRLRIGDRVIDGSVAGNLERLKRTLAE